MNASLTIAESMPYLKAGGPFICKECGQHKERHGKWWGKYLLRLMGTDHDFVERSFADWKAKT